MSGLSFSERVKMLLQKRLDTTKWPLGDSGQGPGAIRYLTDGQGNIIALLTTSINPNDPEPIGPGSAEAAGEVDPILLQVDHQLPYTATKETNVKIFSLVAEINGTDTDKTFEKPVGTDYSVPASKKYVVTSLDYSVGTAAIPLAMGYGDDGVEGTVEPTNFVYLVGTTIPNNLSIIVPVTADTLFHLRVSVEVPADKFPWFACAATSAVKAMMIHGYEADA